MLALSLVTKLRARTGGTPPAKPAPPSRVASIETRFHRAVDANGAMTKIVAKTTPPGSLTPTVITTDFFYDVRQRMTRVTLNDGRTIDNEYYPDSPLRLSFTEPGAAPSGGAKTFTMWDPLTQNPLQDLDAANATLVDYIMGSRIDEPLGRVAAGATHTFIGDHQMSIRGLADSTGILVNQYAYGAFGPGRSQVEAIANRLRYTARELDAATGHQYTRNRYLALALGRWTQRDPLGFVAGSNHFAYARNNPVSRIDPSGLLDCSGVVPIWGTCRDKIGSIDKVWVQLPREPISPNRVYCVFQWSVVVTPIKLCEVGRLEWQSRKDKRCGHEHDWCVVVPTGEFRDFPAGDPVVSVLPIIGQPSTRRIAIDLPPGADPKAACESVRPARPQ